MSDPVKLPGLTDTTPYTSQDAFQKIADQFNVDLGEFVSEKLKELLERGELPADSSGAGPTIVAIVGAMLNCAGRLCASFEPIIDGDVLASIAKAQFNAGRADQMRPNESIVQ